MNNTEILIVGAGATGLMAAYTLSKAGKKVAILEARNRFGGRIHTLDGSSFFKHAELGAEFIHGNLPVTLQLLKEAGIDYYSASGEMWHYDKGVFSNDPQQMEDWDMLMKKLNALKTDITIGDFLQQEFSEGKYDDLRISVTRFVAGFDTADIHKASAFALRQEWQADDEDAQYRIDGGYCKMMDYLVNESKASGAQLFLNTVVKDIYWEGKQVKIVTADGVNYKAEKVIIALPLGVLQAENTITFYPPIHEHTGAIQQMGFGAIIKILLEFRDIFWEDEETTKVAGHSLKEMGFLLSNEEIPTWWTQYPKHSTVLTGWLGGPNAEAKKDTPNEELLQQAIQSLANVFKRDVEDLKTNLVTWNVINWTADPFTLGSYAYDTIEAPDARRTLSNPVNDTIYFAGEYLYDGPAMGTVEAALSSGLDAAKKILA